MSICPNCGGKNMGPGPNYDNLRWIGCYDCGHGFTSTPRKPKSMKTDSAKQAMNVAIAEKMGWRPYGSGYYWLSDGEQTANVGPPDFTGSLDDMATAEATFITAEERSKYLRILEDVIRATGIEHVAVWGVIAATAAQRAEAFCRLRKIGPFAEGKG